MAFSILLFMMSNFFVRIFGLLREVLIANFYGTSDFTDAYIIANNIPTVLFASLGSAIATTFVPMYTKVSAEQGKKQADSFTIHLIEVIMILCAVIVLAGELFTGQFVSVFASGFTGDVFELTVLFTKILFPSLFFMSLFDLFGSYLQQHEMFKPIGLVPIIGNGAIILALLISNIYANSYILVWGTLIGLSLQVLFYIPWIAKCGLFIQKRKESVYSGLRNDVYLKELLAMLIPVFIGAGATEINSIVDKSLASTLGTGSISALNYSYKVVSLFVSIVIASITVVAFPKMAKDADTERFAKTNDRIINGMMSLIVPITVLLIMLRKEVVAILFERGSFGSDSLIMTSSALAFYGIGLPFMGIRDILLKVCYSMRNTKISMVNGVIAALVNIILDFTLIRFFRQNGLAFATSAATMICTFMLLGLLSQKKWILIADIIVTLLKVMIGAGISYGLTWYIGISLYPASMVIRTIILGISYLFIYSITQILLRNKAMISFLEIKKKKNY